MRRGVAGALLCLAVLGPLPAAAAVAVAGKAYCTWTDWARFRAGYVSAEGRVIDRSDPRQITVSEGQSYALFFALVANDRAGFERLLRWTEDNLAKGDLTRHLPAWLWGRGENGQWSVLDDNSASDSDVWIAYSLAEAGQLWNERRYRVLARVMARNILARESAMLPGLGNTLLPAPVGFADGERWRLNPSYVPLQLLRRLDQLQPGLGWGALLPSSERLLHESAPRGFAANWMLYDARQGFLPDIKSEARGSYDAIRVYLWAGMLHPEDPARAALLRRLQPMAQATAAGLPPEKVSTTTGAIEGSGYAGFSAALLPFLRASDESTALETQRSRVLQAAAVRRTEAYYENVLTLFGLGWDQGWYRFGLDGRLQPRWQTPACERSR